MFKLKIIRTHSLDNENTAFRALSRLTNAVANLNKLNKKSQLFNFHDKTKVEKKKYVGDFINGSVGAESELFPLKTNY